jgi:hypothetical protein
MRFDIILEFNACLDQCHEIGSSGPAPLILVDESELDRRRKSSNPRSGAISFSCHVKMFMTLNL